MAFFAIDCDDVDAMATTTMMIAVPAATAADDDDGGGAEPGGGADDGDVVRMTMNHLPMPAFHLMHCRLYLLFALVSPTLLTWQWPMILSASASNDYY